MPVLSARLIAIRAFASEIADMRDPYQILDALDRSVQPLGVRVYGGWRAAINETRMMDAYKVGQNVFPHVSVEAGYWEEFWPEYNKHGGPSALSRLARQVIGFYTWREMVKMLRLSQEERWQVNLASKWGMGDGAHYACGPVTIAYWSKKVLQLEPDERVILAMAAHFAAARLDRGMMTRKSLQENRLLVVELSPQEVKALQKLSFGDELDQIAKSLGVTTSSINNYLDRARKKLKARNRVHAVRLARDAGLI